MFRSLFVLLPMTLWIGGCAGLTTNHAETSPVHDDPTLRTRYLSGDYDAVFSAASKVADTLPRWKIVGDERAPGSILAERQTRLFKFVDDVRIEITQTDDGKVAVNLSSQSRVGKGDFGQNARNIREFLQAFRTAFPP